MGEKVAERRKSAHINYPILLRDLHTELPHKFRSYQEARIKTWQDVDFVSQIKLCQPFIAIHLNRLSYYNFIQFG